MSGILSKGIVLNSMEASVATPITDVQEIPDLGATVEKVETTTLADGSKKYIQGIKEYSDLEFVLLYDNSGATSNYRVLKAFEDAGVEDTFQVELPDGTTFDFSATVTTVIAGASVGDALTFTAMFTLSSEIVVSNPA
jgi:ribosomal protein L19